MDAFRRGGVALGSIVPKQYFPKQHYKSIVSPKSGINRFSASHDINYIPVSISIALMTSTYFL